MTTQQISFYDKAQTDGLLAEKADTADLATVAFTGDYDDLTDKPVIPAAQVNADWNATSGVAEILNKPTIPAAQVNADWDAASGVEQILNKPSLATVATSGSYDDLTNKPAFETFVYRYVFTNQTHATNMISYHRNPTSPDVTFTGVRFRKINGEVIVQSGADFPSDILAAVPNLSNVNVGSANAGKYLKVKPDGTLEYDTPTGTISVTDNTTYYTISY